MCMLRYHKKKTFAKQCLYNSPFLNITTEIYHYPNSFKKIYRGTSECPKI